MKKLRAGLPLDYDPAKDVVASADFDDQTGTGGDGEEKGMGQQENASLGNKLAVAAANVQDSISGDDADEAYLRFDFDDDIGGSNSTTPTQVESHQQHLMEADEGRQSRPLTTPVPVVSAAEAPTIHRNKRRRVMIESSSDSE